MGSFDFRLVDAGPFRLPAIARGRPEGPHVLIIPPLFEEMNRSRRLLSDIGRALAGLGIASLLPDLPGTGDSLDLRAVATWQDTVAMLIAARPCHVVAVRGGCLLTNGEHSEGLYYFSPVSSGSSLLREMMRAQSIADQERTGGGAGTRHFDERFAVGESVNLTGYPIDAAFAAEFGALLQPEPAVRFRTAGLRPGHDIVFEGPAVWRQAEPAPACALAGALAGDIAAWIR